MGGNKKKIEVDFSKCRFIKENMWFFTYQDFCDNRRIIKKMFQEMDKDGRLFYMYYVYASRIKENLQNAIWDYLNFPDIGYEAELLKLNRTQKR